MPAKTPMEYMVMGAAMLPLVAANGIAASTANSGVSINIKTIGWPRFITFLLLGAAATGGIVGTGACKVQVAADNGAGAPSTWHDMLQHDGTSVVAWAAAIVHDRKAVESGQRHEFFVEMVLGVAPL